MAADDTKTSPLILVQALRALAASLVLVGHIQTELLKSAGAVGRSVYTVPRFPGGFGVDLFFCISGFIMVVSSERLFATPGAPMRFLLRRAARLIPLYWLVTIGYVFVLLAGSRGYPGNLGLATLTSLTFVPYPTYGMDGSDVFPLFTLGWSLNYEVFFYLLFSIFITKPRQHAVTAIVSMLLVIVLAGAYMKPDSIALRFWSEPIILEFGFGMIIALVWRRAVKLPLWVCIGLATVCIVVLLVDPLQLLIKLNGMSTQNDFRRVLGWGLPAAGMLIAAVFAEKDHVRAGLGIATAKLLGDASYSLYLIHPFLLITIAKIWKAAGFAAAISWPALGSCLFITSVIAAIALHRILEAPLTRRLHKLMKQFDPSAQQSPPVTGPALGG